MSGLTPDDYLNNANLVLGFTKTNTKTTPNLRPDPLPKDLEDLKEEGQLIRLLRTRREISLEVDISSAERSLVLLNL